MLYTATTTDGPTTTEILEYNGNQEQENEDTNNDDQGSEGQEANSNNDNDSVATAIFGPFTDAILLSLSTICVCCTMLILVVFLLKRHKDKARAIKDLNNIEMMQQSTESTKDTARNMKDNESGTVEPVIEGNGDILTTDRLNIDENIRNRGATFDSIQSRTVSNMTNLNNSPQMMHQASLPNYSQGISMQPSFPGSFSVAQNYLNISYPNGNSLGPYQHQHGSYPNQYNYNQSSISPLPTISTMSNNTEHNLIIPNQPSMMNGSYSSSMNNGNPLLLTNLSSNVSAFSQFSKVMGPMVDYNNPSMQSSYSMHQGQAQNSPYPQQRLPLNAGISLPVVQNRDQKHNQRRQRKSSDANSEVQNAQTPGQELGRSVICMDDEEKVFEDGLHIIYDHNQDDNNSDAISENSDATSEEGIDIIYDDDDDDPVTPDDNMWGQINDCDIVTAGNRNNNVSPGGGVYGNINKNKHVKFNIHMNNDSVYNEDDAQSVVGGVTDIGHQ